MHLSVQHQGSFKFHSVCELAGVSAPITSPFLQPATCCTASQS
jgi:hypothetical protein